MLPAAARLRRRSEFSATVRSGARAGRRRLVLHVAPSTGTDSVGETPRVGFVVGRMVGPATVRNRVRRRLRHVVADRLPRLAAEWPGARVVVRALPPAAAAASRDLAGDFDAALDAARRAAPSASGVAR